MVTADVFKQIMSNWASGVSVVTTRAGNGQPYGLTVSAFTSVSLDPLMILVCLDNRLSGLQAFLDSKTFGVSVLSENQEEISRLFAKRDTVRPPELYIEGVTGVPLIRDSLVTLECQTAEMYPGGDHTIFLGRVQAAELRTCQDGRGPLLYFRGKYRRLAN